MELKEEFQADCTETLARLTAALSLASPASTSCLTIFSKSSILHTSLPVSLAIHKQTSLGNLVMIIGMSRLPYQADVTPSAFNPRMRSYHDLIKNHTKWSRLIIPQLEISSSPSICALIIFCGFPNFSCNIEMAES